MFSKVSKQMKVALAVLAAVTASVAFALQETPITAANRTSGTVSSADMVARDNPNGVRDIGINVYPVVTSVTGSATLTVNIQAKTPQGTYVTVLSSVPTQATSTMTAGNIAIGAGFPATANVSAGTGLPPVFRVQGVVTGTGSTTYSIGVNRITN